MEFYFLKMFFKKKNCPSHLLDQIRKIQVLLFLESKGKLKLLD